MKTFKPMLAATAERIEDLKLPGYISPKYDGIRCLIVDGQAVSRKLEPIPNKYIQDCLSDLPDGLDGELITGDWDDFNTIQSKVMSIEGEPKFRYVVFDNYEEMGNISDRLKGLDEDIDNEFVEFVHQEFVDTYERIRSQHESFVRIGFEGTMFRTAGSPYKFGRSTLKEQYLVKIKDFKDDEAIVTDFLPRYRNDNDLEKDALGYAKRSKAKSKMVAEDMLGSFITNYRGKTLKIGSGFTEEQRKVYWMIKSQLKGQKVKFKFQTISEKGIPRFPIFLGFRND